jgi:hypothetical protein
MKPGSHHGLPVAIGSCTRLQPMGVESEKGLLEESMTIVMVGGLSHI